MLVMKQVKIMSKETKLVQFRILDGTEEEVALLAKALKTIKKKLPINMEFLVTNDRVELRDIKYLINELYTLYKLEKGDGEKDARKD